MRAAPAAAILCGLALAACVAPPGEPDSDQAPTPIQPSLAPATPGAAPEQAPSAALAATPAALLEPLRVVGTGDVADWPGDWSPDGRFYVFFRWSEDAPCSGETVHAYDTVLAREIPISSPDYCAKDVDPNAIWEDDSTLIFGDGPDRGRWEAITLGDEVVRTVLAESPPACVDRGIPLPPALDGLAVSRARWSPDEGLLAIAVVPDDETYRFEDIPGNRPDLRLFQRLDVALFPADGTSEAELRWLGPVFDLGPDSLNPDGESEEDCPGTQIRWSDDGRSLISSMGPVVYDAQTGEALLAPDGPNAGPLGPNVRWSPDDWRVADDSILLDLRSGQQHAPPGILPGYDRGFAGADRFIYVNDVGLAAYDVGSRSTRQLTAFPLAIYVVAPDGRHVAYADDGDLWLIPLPE